MFYGADPRGPKFKCNIGKIYIEHLVTVYCIEKTKIRKRGQGMTNKKEL